ncbi:hypothetical protein [Nocardiopsis sp. CNT312]|uniref:hypothetical protein n=1 Tax=Nocardiopsis sp. CNT312 TaxID=1137268 RepID=UPI00048B79AB|nr:hypothetical protein [Nocardiopsis sp. CNT312]
MIALQIRGVREETRDELARLAKGRGQSLQAYLLDLVETEARRSRNAQVLRRYAGRGDGVRGEAVSAAEIIRAGRRDRTERYGIYEESDGD